ncbi:MFS transporter [Arthrobacter tumbae]|nr:MFS family permease [Arthrobacter tumbae]
MSILTALSLSAFLLLGIPVGVWVDRMRKRRILIGADILRATVLLTIPVAFATDTLSIWHLLVVAAVISVADVFFTTADSTALPMVVGANQLDEATARLLTAKNTISVAAPGIAGLLLRTIAAPFVLLLSALAYLSSAFLLNSVHLPESVQTGSGKKVNFWESAREGLAFTLNHRELRPLFTSNMLINASTMLGASAKVVFALNILLISPAMFASLGVLGAVGALLGSLAAMPIVRFLGIGACRVSASLLSIVVVAFIPLAGSLPGSPVIWVGLSTAGWSFLTAVIVVAGSGIIPRLTETAMLGRVSSCIRLFTLGIMPIASLAGGALAVWLGLVPTLWIWACVAGAAALPILASPIRSWKVFPEHLDVNQRKVNPPNA